VNATVAELVKALMLGLLYEFIKKAAILGSGYFVSKNFIVKTFILVEIGGRVAGKARLCADLLAPSYRIHKASPLSL
jgi:hypothetical protein